MMQQEVDLSPLTPVLRTVHTNLRMVDNRTTAWLIVLSKVLMVYLSDWISLWLLNHTKWVTLLCCSGRSGGSGDCGSGRRASRLDCWGDGSMSGLHYRTEYSYLRYLVWCVFLDIEKQAVKHYHAAVACKYFINVCRYVARVNIIIWTVQLHKLEKSYCICDSINMLCYSGSRKGIIVTEVVCHEVFLQSRWLLELAKCNICNLWDVGSIQSKIRYA